MKTFKKISLAVLAVLPAVYTAVAVLFYMPNTVAVHFGVDGMPDRYGSKYEAFILPAAAVLVYVLYLIIIRFAGAKKTDEKTSKNIDVISTIIIAIFVVFNVLGVVILIAMNDPDKLSGPDNLLYVTMTAAMGVLFIVCGNIMPKTKRNSMIGFRLPFCMDTDEHWYIANRAGGIAMVLAGIVTVVCGLIFRDITAVFIMLASIIVSATVAFIYSYGRIKKEKV